MKQGWSMMQGFGPGVKIVVTPLLTKSVTVKRRWRERLLTRPWRPFRKTKTVEIPDMDFYIIGGVVYCHPETEQRLRDDFRKRFGYEL